MSSEFTSEQSPSGHPTLGSRFDPFGDIDPSLMFDCNAMLARLYSFLDGELNDDRRAKIQLHLDGCPSCFSKFDFEAELRIVIAKRVTCRVPATLVERIRNSICTAPLMDNNPNDQ
jgi:mycothiol system anti-sigma-R factor